MTYLRLISTFALACLFSLSAFSENETPRYIEQFELKTVSANGIDVSYRLAGASSSTPVLLIMGLGASHKVWTDNLVKGLVGQNHPVILFDNRDTGGSSNFESWGEPYLWWELLKDKLGFEVNAPYSLDDMANDTVALMDALNVEKAHIVGASMGGMIAQIVAAKHPERTQSLVSIMSTTGAKHLPDPSSEALKSLKDLAEGDAAEGRAERMRQRGFFLESMPRQITAILKTGNRSADVASISAPTLILHGQDDELIYPAHGEHTAELIKGSKFVLFPGMAHNIPEDVLPGVLLNMNQHFAM
jgi:pimeloyl-ACP methyl ester carboxylesterase